MPDRLDSSKYPVPAFRETVTGFNAVTHTARKRPKLSDTLPTSPSTALIVPPDKAEIRATLAWILPSAFLPFVDLSLSNQTPNQR